MIHARKAFNIAWILVLLDLLFFFAIQKVKGNKAVKVRLIIFAESSTSEPITREASTTSHPWEKVAERQMKVAMGNE